MTASSVAPAPGSCPWIAPSRMTMMRSQSARISGRSLDATRQPAPRTASRRMISWISNLAPTSTPLVGSSSRPTFGGLVREHALWGGREPLGDHDLLLIAAAQRVGRHFDAGRLDAPLVHEGL